MNEKLRATLKQFVDFWRSLSIVKRVSMIVATAAVLVGILAAASLGSRVDYTYLFTELSTEDAAAISEKLKAMKVPYRLEAGGRAIQVPEERVHQLRLELASSGLPRGGGVGFEIFDRSNLGATEFDQRVNLRRALEGELSRSIGTIDGVQAARVHLVLPENRLFAARKESASASVVLKLRNGRDFGRREVAGIVHLVSSAVPGLSHDRVSVVSTEGVTLHRPSAEGGGLGSDNEAEQAREIAGGMEAQVRSLIERVVGPGNSDIRINVDLNTASRERNEEHYTPERTALRSEHKTEEADGVEGATVAGVPGAQSNLPHTDATANTKEAAAGGGNVFRKTQTRNWEVDRVTEKTLMPAGGVARLSVAVLVNGSYNTVNGKPVFVPRTAAQIAQLDAVVKNAVGFDERRGDSVRVEAAQFARLDDDLTPEPTGLLAFAKKQPVAVAALVGAFLVFSALAVFMVRRNKKLKAEALARAVPVLEAPPHLAALAAGEEGPAKPADLETIANAADLRAEALLIAAKDPATAAIVLKKWLNSSSASAAA